MAFPPMREKNKVPESLKTSTVRASRLKLADSFGGLQSRWDVGQQKLFFFFFSLLIFSSFSSFDSFSPFTHVPP